MAGLWASTLGTMSGTFHIRKQRGLFSLTSLKAAAKSLFPAQWELHSDTALLQRVSSIRVHIHGLGLLKANVLPNVTSTCNHCLKAQGPSIASILEQQGHGARRLAL